MKTPYGTGWKLRGPMDDFRLIYMLQRVDHPSYIEYVRAYRAKYAHESHPRINWSDTDSLPADWPEWHLLISAEQIEAIVRALQERASMERLEVTILS